MVRVRDIDLVTSSAMSITPVVRSLTEPLQLCSSRPHGTAGTAGSLRSRCTDAVALVSESDLFTGTDFSPLASTSYRRHPRGGMNFCRWHQRFCLWIDHKTFQGPENPGRECIKNPVSVHIEMLLAHQCVASGASQGCFSLICDGAGEYISISRSNSQQQTEESSKPCLHPLIRLPGRVASRGS